MEKRAVLITGCSSGIGHALAVGLQARGYRVFAAARQAKDVAALADIGLESLRLDLNDSTSLQEAVAEVLRRTDGELYGLINNGAYGQPGAVEDLSREALRQQFETNVFGTQELTNRLLRVFRTQQSGRIIQISSMLGIVSMAYRGAYNASKHALEALSDTLRLELRDSGIHVSLIEPGPISSRFRENAMQAFLAHIDRETSVHQQRYAATVKRLQGSKPLPFTLPPEAVLPKVIHALEADKPKARYPVTVPTYVFGTLKRVLPTRWLDRALHAVASREQR